ncbi:hypothetical protein PCC7424_0223 [Gloeothece citriformis PCC 7424]|uniref:Glycerophosphoryl diester phosphodiesterase membrane domain-containing protein n=1 Tax=Gloeothece citriformis (strain PCC 7424) TaxID=65393 RepID=B7KAL9_GLOC7|nr:DUF6159 family protein [Gloeothece citriformis]ACK68691.1 hypothetical protein PCC7424_0223 [Gloeothece citriformis PCC 7424]
MKQSISKSWHFLLNTLAILQHKNHYLLFLIIPLILEFLIAFLGLLPLIPNIFSQTEERLKNLGIILIMYILILSVTLITNFSNAILILLLQKDLENNSISINQAIKKTGQIKFDLLIYSLVNSIIKLISLILNITINLLIGVIVLPALIQKISTKRKGVSLTLQLNMCLPIMVCEGLAYEKARHRAIQIMTQAWGKNLSETKNIGVLLLITILPLVFLIGIPILTVGIIQNKMLLIVIGWAILFVAIIVSQVFSTLCSQIYAFAAYRYIVEGKNDVYADPSIAPNAYRITQLNPTQ